VVVNTEAPEGTGPRLGDEVVLQLMKETTWRIGIARSVLSGPIIYANTRGGALTQSGRASRPGRRSTATTWRHRRPPTSPER
jgi:hypothetical protein